MSTPTTSVRGEESTSSPERDDSRVVELAPSQTSEQEHKKQEKSTNTNPPTKPPLVQSISGSRQIEHVGVLKQKFYK